MEADDVGLDDTNFGDTGLDNKAAWGNRSAAEASDHALADRFDAIQAERVIHRALELEAQSLDQPLSFDADQLERIADEIGIEATFVRQALGEVRLRPPERSWVERRILPDEITEVVTLRDMTRAEVDETIHRWMTEHEGLMRGDILGDGIEWDVDRRWASRARAMKNRGGNRISRVAGGDVVHRVHSIGETEHVVAMQSEGIGPIALAKSGLILAGGLMLFAVVGSFAATDQTLADYVAGYTYFGIAAVAMALGGVTAARLWADRIGRSLRRSLTGLFDFASPSSKKSWFRRRAPRG